jgi:hypothetical protein
MRLLFNKASLVERAEDVFSFSHLTLQEYLTAQYIDDHRQIEQLVAEHLTHRRWEEVFLLVAGLMRGGADELLLQMEKAAQAYINTPKLQALLMWAEQATSGSEGDIKPVAKRAAALCFAIDVVILLSSLLTLLFALPVVLPSPLSLLKLSFWQVISPVTFSVISLVPST